MELNKDIKWRLYLVFFGLFGVGLAVVFQMFKLQITEGEFWREKAARLATSLRPVEATRGNILADDGSMLATSVPVFDVRFDTQAQALSKEVFDENLDSLSICLSKLFKDKSSLDYKQNLLQARKRKERYYLVKRNIDYNQLQVVKTFPLFRKGRYKGGVLYEKKDTRKMPFGFLAQRSIGYLREGVKPVGIEGAYNKYLQGTKGERIERRLTGGVWMPVGDENEIEPEDGMDVYTTIDINMQDVAENALLQQLAKHNADHGSVVLMEVATGAIKAIANLTRNENGSFSENYNYAIGELTEPGSTFKLASLIAAIDDGYVTLSDTVDTKDGVTKYFGVEMRDTKEGGHGRVTVQHAFEVSSNIGISQIISKHYGKNPQSFIDKLYAMHLNKPLGFDLAGEGIPKIKRTDGDEKWSGITLTQMAIGYELLVTPMQILALYNAVANNGRMVRPQFITHVGRNGKIKESFETEVLVEKICSDRTLEQVRKALEGVVDHGTATNLKSASYQIAGKTGTARIANTKYGYGAKNAINYQASFVGYFPADNPMYSCMVVVNAPSNSVYYGNVVAGPIFRELADKVYSKRIDTHKEINTNQLLVQHQAPKSMNGSKHELFTVLDKLKLSYEDKATTSDWIKTNYQEKKVVAVQAPNSVSNSQEVPDVTGMGLQDALYLLENRGLKVELVGKGKIKWQSIPAGNKVPSNATITLGML